MIPNRFLQIKFMEYKKYRHAFSLFGRPERYNSYSIMKIRCSFFISWKYFIDSTLPGFLSPCYLKSLLVSAVYIIYLKWHAITKFRYCATLFNEAWTQFLCRLKSCSRRVGDLRWWASLTMVFIGNKAKRLLSVNHTKKTIHHHLRRSNEQVNAVEKTLEFVKHLFYLDFLWRSIAISLAPLYHFHQIHRHLDVSRAIAAENSPLHIASI